MAKNAIIVGMPRSGTSLSAAIFANKGYFVTENTASELKAPNRYNPFGYFEAQSLIEFNVDLFKQLGFEEHNTWTGKAISDACAERIPELTPMPAHREYCEALKMHSPWVWKDPRLCYTIGYWWQLLDQKNTRVILLNRSPQDIYQSFLRVGWREKNRKDRRDVYERVKKHLGFAKATLDRQAIPYVEIDYRDYFERSQEIAEKLSETFDIELSAKDLNAKASLDHSRGKGKWIAKLHRIREMMPASLKQQLKGLIAHSPRS